MGLNVTYSSKVHKMSRYPIAAAVLNNVWSKELGTAIKQPSELPEDFTEQTVKAWKASWDECTKIAKPELNTFKLDGEEFELACNIRDHIHNEYCRRKFPLEDIRKVDSLLKFGLPFRIFSPQFR